MQAHDKDMASIEDEIGELLNKLEAKDRIILEHKDSRKVLQQVSSSAFES